MVEESNASRVAGPSGALVTLALIGEQAVRRSSSTILSTMKIIKWCNVAAAITAVLNSCSLKVETKKEGLFHSV